MSIDQNTIKKERPILFSGAMVRALLDGRKTQTRRVIKTVGDDGGFVLLDYGDGAWPYRSDDGDSATHTVKRGGKLYHDETPHACPYGYIGDRLWVREGFSGPHYQSKSPPSEWSDSDPIWYWADGNPESGDWTIPKPSIHMPRWASRILLEVTGVRVERLHDISEADAIAEGVRSTGDGAFHIENDTYRSPDPVECYARLWESINGDGSWSANPWVWAVVFKRVES